MLGLVGRNNIVSFAAIIIVVVAAGSAMATDSYSKTCIGNNLVLTNITPTIQTIAYVSNDDGGGKVSLIRGRIEFMTVNKKVAAGYLSIRFFNEDGLIGLEGDNDKEGFFIINKENRHVEAGLDGKSFFDIMFRICNEKEFNLLKPDQISAYGDCQEAR